MSYGNRSKEYDWFKGGNAGKNGKNPKSTLKTIWRFTSIFLKFSLFFFSMWGCAQVLIIKTDNSVGKGLEFYNSEEEIAPHVTEFSATKDVNGIYQLERNTENIWLNKTENSEELQAVQNVLKSDNIYENGYEVTLFASLINVFKSLINSSEFKWPWVSTHKLSDSFKGLNEYAMVVQNTPDGSTHGEFKDGDLISALSSEQWIYQGTSIGTNINLYSDGIEYSFDFGKFGKSKENQFALGLISQINTLTTDPTYFPDGILSTKLTYNPGDTNQNLIAYNSQKNAFSMLSEYLRITLKGNILDVTKLSDANALKNLKDGDWFLDINTTTSKPITTTKTWYLYSEDKSLWEKASPGSGIKLSAAGPSITKTHYRPIITWKHAWVRGVGPFYGLFVWPIAKMSVAITNGLGMNGGWESLFAITMIVFILRILAFGITFKSILQQTKQQEVQAKKAVIDAKYANYKGNKQMEARKRQETADLYKKEKISPLGALSSLFITMPIFLSIWRVIGGVPHLKSTVWLGINFSATSYKELFAGEWQYLPLMLFAGLFAAFSQIYPRLLTKRRDKNRINVHQKAAMKKNNKTQNIIMVVYVVMAIIFSAGIQIYWIVGGIWQIIQATITHHVLIYSRKKAKNRVKV